MAWIPQSDRSHFLYESSASQYYWDYPPNPGASDPDLVLANCTTLCYGRAIENGYPAPVTSFRNANRWHNYVNTKEGWEVLDYEAGMQLYAGDIVEWSGNTHQDSEGDYVEDNHVATIEEDGTNPYQSSSWWTYRDTSKSYQAISDYFQKTNKLKYRFYHYTKLSTESSESSGGNKPKYVLRYKTAPQPDAPEIQITASSGEIRIPVNQETGYATISIEVTKIPESESDPFPLRDMSSGFTREWITDGWELSTYTEDGTTYQRVYGKMRIIADRTAPDDAFVRFYQTYSSGYASATVNFNVIKETEKRTAILFLQYDGGAYEIR